MSYTVLGYWNNIYLLYDTAYNLNVSFNETPNA